MIMAKKLIRKWRGLNLYRTIWLPVIIHSRKNLKKCLQIGNWNMIQKPENGIIDQVYKTQLIRKYYPIQFEYVWVIWTRFVHSMDQIHRQKTGFMEYGFLRYIFNLIKYWYLLIWLKGRISYPVAGCGSPAILLKSLKGHVPDKYCGSVDIFGVHSSDAC